MNVVPNTLLLLYWNAGGIMERQYRGICRFAKLRHWKIATRRVVRTGDFDAVRRRLSKGDVALFTRFGKLVRIRYANRVASVSGRGVRFEVEVPPESGANLCSIREDICACGAAAREGTGSTVPGVVFGVAARYCRSA